MPIWATIYLLLFVASCLVGLGLALRDEGFRWRHISDCVAHLIFAVVFAGYWLSAIFDTLGFIAPILFVAALVWEICTGPSDLREIWREPEFSKAMRFAITFLVPLLAWPLYITAGVGLFRFYGRA